MGHTPHLRVDELVTAGTLGVVIVLTRAGDKYFGAWIGGRLSGMTHHRARSVGMALIPQAGLAIGLAYLVGEDPALAPVQSVIINLVTASIVVNELVGAPLVRAALVRTGEGGERERLMDGLPRRRLGAAREVEQTDVPVAPWPQQKLQAPEATDSCAIIGIAHPGDVRPLTRLGALLGHFYHAVPMAVHVVGEEEGQDYWKEVGDEQSIEMFRTAIHEAETLGYNLHTEVESDEDAAEGILSTARDHNARVIVVGHPQNRRSASRDSVVDRVISGAECPVVVVRFAGPLAGGRILIPLITEDDLCVVRPVVRALGVVSEHTITLLRLMPPESSADELRRAEEEVHGWCVAQPMAGNLNVVATAAVSRVHRVLEAAEEHDVLTMAMHPEKGFQKALFGSLAREVAERVDRTTLLVYGSPSVCPLTDTTGSQSHVGKIQADRDQSDERRSSAE